jgi:CDP-4-dehydro-6-deoxyglucose reductase, E3
MLPPTFDARVTHTRPLSPSVRELTLSRVDEAPFEFEPGQWVSLVLQSNDGELRRAYSIASAPGQAGAPSSFELAVTRVETGVGSVILHALSPGDVVRVIGPQGFFTRPKLAAPPALFVGTGTGLAPLRSMIHAALAGEETTPLWLLFGARSEHDVLYRDELEELAKRHPRLRVEVTLSRGSDAWTGKRGYVQTHTRALYEELAAAGGDAPHVYACGLERMVGAVRALLRKEIGLPRQLVHTERYD